MQIRAEATKKTTGYQINHGVDPRLIPGFLCLQITILRIKSVAISKLIMPNTRSVGTLMWNETFQSQILRIIVLLPSARVFSRISAPERFRAHTGAVKMIP